VLLVGAVLALLLSGLLPSVPALLPPLPPALGAAAAAAAPLWLRQAFAAVRASAEGLVQLTGSPPPLSPLVALLKPPHTRAVFSPEQLAHFNGVSLEPGRPETRRNTLAYLSILGHVFDVGEGLKHYARGGAYNHFTGYGQLEVVPNHFKTAMVYHALTRFLFLLSPPYPLQA
jgi:hypothetical protein